MTEIIGGSVYQYVWSGMIMAGSLWGLFSTPRLIPLFTRRLTRHLGNVPGAKGLPNQRAS
ncbi:MAG: hypothetical protein NPIRA06_13640 [Nitrospirales bacterium]|nr:MAG: hypothetical protein NPIRA06_13640 [Nitrospirales bacterium]